MTKTKFLIAALLLQCLCISQGSAQLVYPVETETSVVPAGAEVLRNTQTFAYAMENIDFYGSPQNLYLTAWTSFSPVSGFHWRRATPSVSTPCSVSTIDEGVIMLSGPSAPGGVMYYNISDLSTVFITDGSGNIVIIATFYGASSFAGAGHYMQVYKWDLSGVSLLSTTLLSSASSYGRISLDAHKLYAAVVVWEEGTRLYMKGVLSNAGFVEGPTVAIPTARYRGYIPDVAFAHRMAGGPVDDLSARVVFVAYGSFYPTVFRVNFFDLMAAAPAYITDDVNPDPVPLPGVVSHIAGENLKIDCPDHSPVDDWAYIYTPDRRSIKVRGRQNFSPVSTVVLNASSPDLRVADNQQVAIHYNHSGNIYTGWRSNYTAFAPGQRYVGKIFSFSGGVPPTHSVISNGSYAHSSIAFSKQDDLAQCLFASYIYLGMPFPVSSHSYDVMYKLKPFSTGVFFSDVKTTGNISVSLSPNPFTESLQIDYQGDPDRPFSVIVINSLGQSVWIGEGEISALQHSLNEKLGELPSGYYIFRFQDINGDYTETIKMTKI